MNPLDRIHSSWEPLLHYLNQESFLHFKYEILPNILYYPEDRNNIFRVFSMPLQDIKVVILGQDPYHGRGQATGLAFAVCPMTSTPPSLKFIHQELYGIEEIPAIWKTLEHWEEQGVFLLNTALTVESGRPGSHLEYWNEFIQQVIAYIGRNHPCIWLLWGQKAQRFMFNLPAKSLFNVQGYNMDTITQIPISEDYNYVLRAAHPAAEAYQSNAGFLGCNHFKFANIILQKQRKKIINF
jgi:uracil-DNA glycosylase